MTSSTIVGLLYWGLLCLAFAAGFFLRAVLDMLALGQEPDFEDTIVTEDRHAD